MLAWGATQGDSAGTLQHGAVLSGCCTIGGNDSLSKEHHLLTRVWLGIHGCLIQGNFALNVGQEVASSKLQ